MRRFGTLTRRIFAIFLLILGAFGLLRMPEIRIDEGFFAPALWVLLSVMLTQSIVSLVAIAMGKPDTFVHQLFAVIAFMLTANSIHLPAYGAVLDLNSLGTVTAFILWPGFLALDLLVGFFLTVFLI